MLWFVAFFLRSLHLWDIPIAFCVVDWRRWVLGLGVQKWQTLVLRLVMRSVRVVMVLIENGGVYDGRRRGGVY